MDGNLGDYVAYVPLAFAGVLGAISVGNSILRIGVRSYQSLIDRVDSRRELDVSGRGREVDGRLDEASEETAREVRASCSRLPDRWSLS